MNARFLRKLVASFLGDGRRRFEYARAYAGDRNPDMFRQTPSGRAEEMSGVLFKRLAALARVGNSSRLTAEAMLQRIVGANRRCSEPCTS